MTLQTFSFSDNQLQIIGELLDLAAKAGGARYSHKVAHILDLFEKPVKEPKEDK